MNILGLYTFGHDTGASLISGSSIIALAEERLTRVKHSPRMFPELSMRYCLDALNVRSKDVDLIVLCQVYDRKKYPVREQFLARVGDLFPNAEVAVINHHDAHAAAAFFCSPFEEAAILIHDGMGEAFHSHEGIPIIETETLYYGTGNRFTQIQKTAHFVQGRKIDYTCGPGRMYTILSDKYLGFGPYNEGKMMGLAPYGGASLFEKIPLGYWYREIMGHVVCNPRITWPDGPNVSQAPAAKGNQTILQSIAEFFRDQGRKLFRPLAIKLALAVIPERVVGREQIFPEIRLPRPPRDPSVSLPDDYYASVAFAGQHVLERVAVANAKRLIAVTRSENICIAGGIGLNIDTNKKFLDEAGFGHIFIQPGASDTGIALGSALYGYHVLRNQPRFWTMRSAALGRSYGENEIRSALQSREGEIEIKASSDIAREAAGLLASGKILGWFYGGAEYGPRALGHRSILCDARIPDMKDILNNRVKHREPWRPFAASILRERMGEYFELEEESPFMLLVAPVRKEKRSLVPAIVHVDGTCRIQSVTPEANGRYYDLIENFSELTGTPLILNTSFNLGGDPIVETPKDALDCFLGTDVDHLVLENYLVSKRKKKS